MLSAIKTNATAAEVDVRARRDGQLYILHDTTLDRTTNGKDTEAIRHYPNEKALCRIIVRFEIPYQLIGKTVIQSSAFVGVFVNVRCPLSFTHGDADCFPTNIVDHEQHDVRPYGLSCSNSIGRKYHG